SRKFWSRKARRSKLGKSFLRRTTTEHPHRTRRKLRLRQLRRNVPLNLSRLKLRQPQAPLPRNLSHLLHRRRRRKSSRNEPDRPPPPRLLPNSACRNWEKIFPRATWCA